MESSVGTTAASIRESGRMISWTGVGSLLIRMGSRSRWSCQRGMLLRREVAELVEVEETRCGDVL